MKLLCGVTEKSTADSAIEQLVLVLSSAGCIKCLPFGHFMTTRLASLLLYPVAIINWKMDCGFICFLLHLHNLKCADFLLQAWFMDMYFVTVCRLGCPGIKDK